MWKIIILAAIVHCVLSKSYSKCGSGSSRSSRYLDVQKIKSSAKYAMSAVWDEDTCSALYIDFGVKKASKPCLFRYDSKSGKTYSASIQTNGKKLPAPTFIIPVKTSSKSLSKVIVGLGKYIYTLKWDGKSESASILKKVILGTEGEFGPHERTGLVHCDPSGRILHVSSFDTRLCRPPANQTIEIKQNGKDAIVAVDGLKLITGFAYVGENVYALDTCTKQIIEIIKNNDKGRVVYDFKDIGKKDSFLPVGLEAGSDGTLYTAGYSNGCLYAIDLKSKKAQKVIKLRKGINSISFGGKNSKGGDDLYVTAGRKRQNFAKGKYEGYFHSDTSLYKICGVGSGVTFKRTDVCS